METTRCSCRKRETSRSGNFQFITRSSGIKGNPEYAESDRLLLIHSEVEAFRDTVKWDAFPICLGIFRGLPENESFYDSFQRMTFVVLALLQKKLKLAFV